MEIDFRFISALVIFIVVYGLIIFRNIRGIKIPIWMSMTLGAAGVLILQIISIDEAVNAINFDVILFLLGMFILVSGLELSGVLQYTTNKILSFAKTPNQILFFILFVMGLFSAFLINDTIALVATPIVIGIARQMNLRPSLFLIPLAFSVTIGSIMTPMGNPQNLLISLHSGMEFPLLTFLQYLFLPTMACMFATFFILKWYYKNDFKKAIITKNNNTQTILHSSLAKKSVIVVIITVCSFFVIGIVKLFGIETELNFSHIAVFGGLSLLIIGNNRKDIVSGINWKIIVFFLAMFVLMHGLWSGGIIEMFQSIFLINVNSDNSTNVLNIIVTSVMTSQLMSNVPFVALYIPILENHGISENDTISWIALAAGSTIAGNLTILGAASTIIILEIAEQKHKVSFTFREFFKIGAVVTAVNILILIFFLIFLINLDV
jgi:Na+/H+ antiporter NhaD/arsenite permease-like protein